VLVDRFTREDVRRVLDRYGISTARRASDVDGSEEIILVSRSVYEQVDVDGLTRGLMDVLPHVKVWVAPDGPRWSGEPI
jgi:intein-encoded DNA endonuclease-like protein